MSDHRGGDDGDADAARDAVRDGPSGGVEGEARTPEVSGRPYLLAAAATVTLFVSAASYVVAANNAVEAVTVFGLLRLPGFPLAMALYGAVLAVTILATLFGLVTVASRYDDAAGH